MKLTWEKHLLYNEEGNEGGTGKDFSAWNDLNISANTEEVIEPKEEENSEEIKDLGEDESKAEEKADIVNTDIEEKPKEQSEADIAEILKTISEKEENKTKSKEELQTLLEEELNKSTNKEFALGEESKEAKVEATDKIDWGKQALELGLINESKEDITSESFKDLIKTKIESKTSAIKEQYSSYERLNEESKNFVHFLEENGIEALDSYLNPAKAYDQYLSMSKEELVENELKAIKDEKGERYYTDEQIADRMIDFEDDEKALNKEYDRIKISLINGKNNTLKQLSDRLTNDRIERESKASQFNFDVTTTAKAVSEMQEFIGVKIADTGKESINKMIVNGEVEKLMKDPKFLANSLMFHKFGEQAINNIRKNEFDKGRNKAISRLHNIPVINGGNNGAGINVHEEKSGTFADWKTE